MLASVELVGVKAIFTLRSPQAPSVDKYTVISFADETHLLLMDGEEMEDIQLASKFYLSSHSLLFLTS